jgi:outer membrane protein assembly factor BamB
MKLYHRLLISLLLLAGFSSLNAQNQSTNWTFYRGSNLDAISSNKDLPLTWSEKDNMIWKTTIHGRGASSPVIFGDQIWVTTADPSGKKLYAVCCNFKSGEIIHDIEIFQHDTVPRIHSLNTFATPTPAIEDGYVYVHFGSLGTACLETNSGKVIWKRDDLKCNHFQGPASSPIIYKDLLILHYEGVDIQFVIALNKKTGKTVWKSIRPQEYYTNRPPVARKAYITPIIINADGRDMLISNGAEVCIAYDPMTGAEIWRVPHVADTTISMPMFSNGLVIFNASVQEPIKLMAVRPEGHGDITETNLVWSIAKDVPAITSPFAKDGLIYMIHERGTFTCLESATGKTIFTNKLSGQFYSSPVCADGHIYITAKNGTIYVLNEGKEFKVLAENKLEGEFMATSAISGNSLIIRSNNALYRIMKK